MRQQLLLGILIDLRLLLGIHQAQQLIQQTLVPQQIRRGLLHGILAKPQVILLTLPGLLRGILLTVPHKAPVKALIHRGLLAKVLVSQLIPPGLRLGLRPGIQANQQILYSPLQLAPV